MLRILSRAATASSSRPPSIPRAAMSSPPAGWLWQDVFAARRSSAGGGGSKGVFPDECLIVLNYNLPHTLLTHWSNATIRVCADGGVNRLWDATPVFHPKEDPGTARARYIPDAVVGDLDSVRREVIDFYESKGTAVVDLSHDQDSHDLDKCLRYGEERLRSREGTGAAEGVGGAMRFIVAGALGGRLDHELANLNALYMHRHLEVVLVGEHSAVRLLRKGHNVIRPARGIEGPVCGIVPLQGPATGTSKGLKYNLEDTLLEVGGLISTSNEILAGAEEVEVWVDNDVLWTTELMGRP